MFYYNLKTQMTLFYMVNLKKPFAIFLITPRKSTTKGIQTEHLDRML